MLDCDIKDLVAKLYKDNPIDQVKEIKPIFSHVGILTFDRDKAANFLLAIPGAKITATRTVTFEQDQMIVAAPCNIKIHFVNINGMDFEIIEPFDCPDSYMMQHMAKYGEGFHHLAYDFATVGEHLAMIEQLAAKGYKVVHACVVRDLIVHYVEAADESHEVLELKSRYK